MKKLLASLALFAFMAGIAPSFAQTTGTKAPVAAKATTAKKMTHKKKMSKKATAKKASKKMSKKPAASPKPAGK